MVVWSKEKFYVSFQCSVLPSLQHPSTALNQDQLQLRAGLCRSTIASSQATPPPQQLTKKTCYQKVSLISTIWPSIDEPLSVYMYD